MKKPNVIFILADDMGYGDFSRFNGGITSTKGLDQIAAEGVTLSQCYSSSPVCGPARASIMTGRYPQRTGVVDTLEARGLDCLKTSEVTMADVFKSNGYKTGLVGKWHLGSIGEEYHPNNRGFDYFFGFRGGWTDYYAYKNIERNGENIASSGKYLTDSFSEQAVDFIKKNKEEPFFLHVAYNAPHFPYQAPKELLDKYMQTGKYTTRVSYIYAMIEAMDIGVSKIIQEVKNQNIEEDTIIIFTSDNGPDFGGQGDMSGQRFNNNLRGSKMLVYDGGIKVPAIIKWKGKLKEDSLIKEVVSHLDWLPTLMVMCGLEVEKELKLDGLDVSKVILGKEKIRRKLFWQWNRYYPILQGNAAIRYDNLKLIHAPIAEHLEIPRFEEAIDIDIKYNPEEYKQTLNIPLPKLSDVKGSNSQLFDLQQDEAESKDILTENKDIGLWMEEELRTWFNEVEKDRNNHTIR